MRVRLLGLAGCFALAGVGLLPPAAGAAPPSAGAPPAVVDTATISASPGVDSGFAGETLRFDGSSPAFYVDEHPGQYFDVLLERGGHEVDMRLHFPAGQSTLAVGHYDDQAPGTPPLLPMDLAVDSDGCQGGGVTDITDIARDAQGTVTRLAMTFSHSCGDLDTVLGEVRYQEPPPDPTLSAAPTRVDYGRQDPGFARDIPVRLTNTTAAPVTVTGFRTTGPFSAVSSSCTGPLPSGAGCEVLTRFRPTAAGPAAGSLVATDSTGAQHTVPLTGIGRSGFTGLKLRSTPGDLVGQNRSYAYTQGNGSQLTYFALGGSYLQMRAVGPGPIGDWWDLSLEAPAGQVLRTGGYFPVQRDRYQNAPNGGLDVGGQGRGCNTLSGSVYVHDLEQTPDGRVLHADLLFRQLCQGSTTPLYGEVAYSAPATTSAIDIHYTQLGAPLLGLPLGPEHPATG
ncbi:MAG: hypothetical protein QOJ32_2897, partial [Frankiaceae bacterium]|nr:hypothetical protein [Frankiaceae bacterium]